MSRKKRRFEQLEAAAATPTEKKIYTNPLQKKVDERLEVVEQKLQGKGRTILYGIGAVAVLAILIFVFMTWSRRSNASAQTALGKAIDISQTRVSDTPAPAGSTEKTFKTEKERAEASIVAFKDVAERFGGGVGEKARYFVAVNKLSTDRPAAITELEGLAASSSDVGKLAKFALAQTRTDDGKLDDAVAIYSQLAAMEDPVVAKDTVNFNLASIYEKQGKTKEAADLYYTIAKTANDAKDLDGKPVRMGETATNAKEKLTQLDPDRAKEIVEPAPENPFGGGGPIGM